MAQEVSSDMSTYRNIISEIKQLTQRLKELRQGKTQLEAKLIKYIEEQDIPGLKYQEIVVKKKEAIIYTRLKKDEKNANITHILESNGVSNPQQVLEEIMKAGKGDPKNKNSLKVELFIPDVS